MNIRQKIIAGNATLLFLVFAALAGILYSSLTQSAQKRLNSELEKYGGAISSELSDEIDMKKAASYKQEIEELLFDASGGVQYLFTDNDGKILAASDKPLTITTFKSGFSDISIQDKKYRLYATSFNASSLYHYKLSIAAPLAEIHTQARLLIIRLILLFPAALLITTVVTTFIITKALRPLDTMISHIQTISGRNINEPIPLTDNHDEVRKLGVVFNEMLSRLDAAFKSQKQFAADASHEIRTPLAIIRSEIEYAQRFVEKTEQKESLEGAIGEVDHLSKMVENLLLLARIDAGQLLPVKKIVELDVLVKETFGSMMLLAEKNSITLDVNEIEKSTVNADPEMLRRAIRNLLDNALKFTPEGGKVQVTLQHTESAARITISDTGPGISESDKQRIFTRFFRSDTLRNLHEGCGLGLAIASDLVRLHNGTISVHSDSDKGTAFIVELPVPAKYLPV